jgi:hypothetical protein
VLLNPAVLVVSGLSDVLGAIGRILLSYLVHMHRCLRSLRQGHVHVGPITWEVLPHASYVLTNKSGKIVAKYVGGKHKGSNTCVWVPKVLVSNAKGPKTI